MPFAPFRRNLIQQEGLCSLGLFWYSTRAGAPWSPGSSCSELSLLVTVHPFHPEFTLQTLILFCCVTSAKSFPLCIQGQSAAEKRAKLIGQIGVEPIILTPLVQIDPVGQGQLPTSRTDENLPLLQKCSQASQTCS